MRVRLVIRLAWLFSVHGDAMFNQPPSIDTAKIAALAKDYYDRPKHLLTIGDANADHIYTAVGKALNQFEKLEQRLANLFVALCEGRLDSASPIRRAYGAIENSTLRRAAIEHAAEVHFGQAWEVDKIRKSFLRLLECVSFASRRRDDIAHGIVQHIRVDSTDYGSFLFPPYYNSARTSPYVLGDGPPNFGLSDFRYTSAQINEFERRFGQLKTVARDWLPLMSRRTDGRIPFEIAVTGGDFIYD